MNIFTQFKMLFTEFTEKIEALCQEKAEKDKEALINTIETKIAFIKTCKLDSIDLENLEEVDDLLTIICEDYNYDNEQSD